MRHFTAYFLIATICTSLTAVDLSACGDKYLRTASRLGAAYEAEHRATVLIYMPRDSAAARPASRLGLRTTLERAGHHTDAVEGDADLDTTLSRRTYDIVIADHAMVPRISAALGHAHGRPTVVPIFHTGSKRENDARRKELGCLIWTGERAYYAAAEIDHVMQLRKARRSTP